MTLLSSPMLWRKRKVLVVNLHGAYIGLTCLLLISSAIRTVQAAETIVIPRTIITATRSERPAFETPQAVTVIDKEEIEQANTSSTPDIFRYSEGVYIQKSNLGGGSPFIRGLTGKQVLLMIDGVRLNNSFYRFGPHQYLNTIDPGIIERIEVVRGPTSVLYGSDALGGTVNIITKSREDFSQPFDADGLLRAHYESSADAELFRAQAEGNWHKIGMIAGVSGRLYDDLDAGGSLGPQLPSEYEEIDADLKLTSYLSEHHKLTFVQQFTRQFDVPKTNEVVLGSQSQFNYEPQERLLTYLEYQGRSLPIFDDVRVNLSYNKQREGEEIIGRATPTVETREVTDVGTFGGVLQLTSRWGQAQRFTYGFDYYRDMFNTRKKRIDLSSGVRAPQTPGVPDNTHYESWALYAQDEIDLWERAVAILGIRYSEINTAGRVGATNLNFSTDAVTGSVNLLYRLTPYLHLVGGFAKGFRAPNIEDFFGRVDFFNEIPNTSLEPEESFNKEVGLKFYNEWGSAAVYYFHADYDGFIERVQVGTQPDGKPIQQRHNVIDAEIQGVETGFSVNVTPEWTVVGALTWTRGEDTEGRPLRRIPPLNGNIRVRYRPTTKLWFEAASVLADDQTRLAPGDITDPRIGPNGTPGYAVFDARAGYEPFLGHEVLLTLENLGDRRYKTHGSGIFNPGFSANLTYQVRFD